jgi:ribosomal protein S1
VQVRILEIDADGRRISLSIKRAIGATAGTTAAAPSPGTQKKRKTPLRGGLDF